MKKLVHKVLDERMMESLEKTIERDDLPKFKKIFANAIECFCVAAKYNSAKIGLYLFKTPTFRSLSPSDVFKHLDYQGLLFYIKFVIQCEPHKIINYVLFHPSVFDFALTKGLLDVTRGENREWKGRYLMYRIATIGAQWAQLDGELPVDLDYYRAMNCMRIRPTFLYQRNLSSLPDGMIKELALYDNIDTTGTGRRLSLHELLLSEHWRPIFLRRYFNGINPHELIELICELIKDRDESSLQFLRDHSIKPSEEYLRLISLIT